MTNTDDVNPFKIFKIKAIKEGDFWNLRIPDELMKDTMYDPQKPFYLWEMHEDITIIQDEHENLYDIRYMIGIDGYSDRFILHRICCIHHPFITL